jgi:hypothetical protein
VTVAVSVLVVPLGLAAALVDQARQVAHSDYAYFWGIFLILIAMAAWDLWRRRRIHPAVLFGAAVLWTGEIITTILNLSPTWRDVMVRLVSAWGYAG